ncbi:hypothetical protein PR003_g30454 [Phytophthora rubi]|uniref:Pectate lyase n=1 Tax=Phytophthora rubi TaxID=129364 RepID=A0A6A3LBA7_9STRA|nr:hypothetical protein PR002_g13685 [Phytophthora rubi]KAE9023216.1 hypothetical protein PR001_g12970 [Phytophthora rubi]KAE9271634.1 hypothetical protein PR003_g30454 [Phytophthora rubi]
MGRGFGYLLVYLSMVVAGIYESPCERTCWCIRKVSSSARGRVAMNQFAVVDGGGGRVGIK